MIKYFTLFTKVIMEQLIMDLIQCALIGGLIGYVWAFRKKHRSDYNHIQEKHNGFVDDMIESISSAARDYVSLEEKVLNIKNELENPKKKATVKKKAVKKTQSKKATKTKTTTKK